MISVKKVSSVKDLMININKDLNKDKNIIINVVANNVMDMLREYTDIWYGNHSPTMYNRTHEFINSLTIRSLGNDYVEIGFDPTKMSLGSNNGFEQHEDRFYPLSDIIDEGWSILNKKEIDGSHAIARTIEYLESSGFLNGLKKQFESNGYMIR